MKTVGTKMSSRKKIALFFLIFGGIGCITPFLNIYDGVEFPNTLPQGLFVDNSGYIFCGSQIYDRIQMYDRNGNFVRGFSTDVGKGRGSLFTFKVESGQLHIYIYNVWLTSERLDRKIIYAVDGNLLQVTDVPSVEYAGYNVINEANDPFGNYYVFKGLLFPRVIKKNNAGSSIIIGTPIYLWFFQMPFPAFALFFVSLIYLAGVGNLFRSRHVKVSTSIKLLFFCIALAFGRCVF